MLAERGQAGQGAVMLSEERYRTILDMVDRNRTVTVRELTSALKISEATARRDISTLAERGRLRRVYGGAAAIDSRTYTTRDMAMSEKESLNREEKERIARYAATLIGPGDFIFLDAGSTTQFLAEAVTETKASFVTNSLTHGAILAAKGCRVIIPGGELKSLTEALVGAETVESLSRYNFTLGFFGTNGVDEVMGFTTPDVSEAMVKRVAMRHCRRPCVLADSGKFSQVASVNFGNFDEAEIITGEVREARYRRCANVIEVSADRLNRA